MLEEEGLPNVFARRDRHARAPRAVVQVWGEAGAVATQCLDASDYSSSLGGRRRFTFQFGIKSRQHTWCPPARSRSLSRRKRIRTEPGTPMPWQIRFLIAATAPS